MKAKRRGRNIRLAPRQLHDNHGAAQRNRDGRVPGVESSASEREAESDEEDDAHRHPDGELQHADQNQRAPGAHQLGHIHLESNDEEKEDEADLGDQFNRLLVMNETEAHPWPHQNAREEITEDEGLFEQARQERPDRGGHDGSGDVGEYLGFVHAERRQLY